MALAVTDEDCFDNAVGVGARGREGFDGAFVGAEVVSQLFLLAMYCKIQGGTYRIQPRLVLLDSKITSKSHDSPAAIRLQRLG